MRILYKLSGIVLCLAAICSCSNLRQLPTYWESDLKSDSIKPTGFDGITKIGWTSYNDSTHLFFAVDVLDPRIQMSVIQNGLTIFIDTTKKMKESCYVKYPVATRAARERSNAGNQQRSVLNNRNRVNPMDELLASIESLDVLWKNGEETFQVNTALDETDFITAMVVDSTNVLTLLVGVPMSLIHPGGFDGLNELTIGFGVPLSGGRMGGPTMSGGQQPQTATGGRGGGGGGRGGGRGGGGRGGGQMSGTPSGGASMMAPNLEKFWYRTVIRKSAIQELN